MDIQQINSDKHLFALAELPLITVYDDNLFLRNDYDVLSLGQRNYLIKFFAKFGFKQKSGRLLSDGTSNIHLPRPNANLAVSAFEAQFLTVEQGQYYCVTPTQFAEALFYRQPDSSVIPLLQQLINKCPFNIEWLRDISYRSDIEQITKQTFELLTEYQAKVVKEKFAMKRSL